MWVTGTGSHKHKVGMEVGFRKKQTGKWDLVKIWAG